VEGDRGFVPPPRPAPGLLVFLIREGEIAVLAIQQLELQGLEVVLPALAGWRANPRAMAFYRVS